MKATILIDNRQDAEGRLFSEHGLSIYFEACGKRILVDTGLSGKAFDNARTLGVDASKVDFLILSHGHHDHTGGLRRFLEENKRGAIICSEKIRNLSYTSDSGGLRHSLNPDRGLISSNIGRFVFLGGNLMVIRDGGSMIAAGACNVSKFPRPHGNRLLRANGLAYNGEDELVVSVVENGRHTVISPCSHSGLDNIVECAFGRTGLECSTFIGGLHLIDGEEDLDCLEISNKIKKIYTGHCTGNMAMARLCEIANAEAFRTGDEILC